jgi:hypothetical protein
MMTLTYEEYYGEDLFRLKRMEQILLDVIPNYPTQSYPNVVEPMMTPTTNKTELSLLITFMSMSMVRIKNNICRAM